MFLERLAYTSEFSWIIDRRFSRNQVYLTVVRVQPQLGEAMFNSSVRTIHFHLRHVCLLLTLTATAHAQSDYLDRNASEIEAFLDRNFSETNSGMAIGLIDKHGSRNFYAGKLDNGTNRTVDGDTVFEMGSVTKVFTSLLLLDAVNRGEMKLEDPVAKYMPDGVKTPAYRGMEITLLNLAVQDSGLPWNTPRQEELLNFKSGKPDFAAYKKGSAEFTVEKLYKLLSSHELPRPPGEEFQYSNVGMALLGHAIERATGRDYESLVVERICKPLGMHDTRITLSDEQISRRAHGHMGDGSKADFWKFQAMLPAGGLLTTTNDMQKFLSASLGINESSLTPLMRQTHVNRHVGSKQFGRTAMPWTDGGVYNPPGSNLLGHAGGGAGSIAFVGFDAANGHGAIVLTNQVKVRPSPVGWTLVHKMPFTRANTAYAVREAVGIGVVLKKDDSSDELRIIQVFPKSPAGKAGIVTDTVITHIGETLVEGKELKECYQLLSGGEDMSIRLNLRNPAGVERVVELKRGRFLTSG